LRHAIELLAELREKEIDPSDEALGFYFAANAHTVLWELARGGRSEGKELWYRNWDSQHAEQVILNLRRAANSSGFALLPTIRRCQILTNLGNTLSGIGRSIEAIHAYDQALVHDFSFGMARGNRALASGAYASIFYDRGPALLFFRFAHADLATALTEPAKCYGLEPGARAAFQQYLDQLATFIGGPRERCQLPNLYSHDLGETNAERQYRRWLLANRLFLNPVNDLGAYSIASTDVLSTPPIVTDLETGPKYQGAFNQLKQGFVSARYLLFKGLQAGEPHYSDRNVLLVNTLDYPVYSLAIEKVKLAFRSFYSLFDQMAFLLNDYLNLGIPERRVGFRTLWYRGRKQEKGVRPDILERANRALQALFWLSKDLYEQRPDFREALEPEAQALADIRNHLEHKYLKVHDLVMEEPSSTLRGVAHDELAFSLSRRDLESKTLKLAQLARAAIIYLSLSMHVENIANREPDDAEGKVTMPMFLDVLEDDWKR
jgi:hypothetical protein